MSLLTRTITEIVTRIRNRCGQANSTFVGDTELGEFVNQSYAGLWDAILDAGHTETFLTSYDGTTVAGTDVYTISGIYDPGGDGSPYADVYRVAGVDVQFQGDWREIQNLPFTKRNRLVNASGWTGPGDTFYRLHNHLRPSGATQIRFFPTPAAVHNFRVWYLPSAIEVDSDNVLVGLNGWEEYVISDVCAMVMEKAEKPQSAAAFIKRRDAALTRIMWAAANFDDSGTEGLRETVNWGEVDPHEHEPLDAS